jgi:hypothetical protein
VVVAEEDVVSWRTYHRVDRVGEEMVVMVPVYRMAPQTPEAEAVVITVREDRAVLAS